MYIKHSIVYADDDFDDYYFLRSAFEEVRQDINLIHANDGWDVLEHLQTLKLPALYPSLIILDINMNGIGGKETLKILKTSNKYKNIPVMMFSSSKSNADADFCNSYGIQLITKPFNFEGLKEAAKNFGEACDKLLENRLAHQ